MALTFKYHGIANREVDAAERLGRTAAVKEHRFFNLPDLKEASDIPRVRFARMPGSYIPLRNGIFYSVAASIGEEVRADCIIGGHIKEDPKTFRDARPVFFALLEKSFRSGSRILEARKMKILRPLKTKTKVEVVKLAASLEVPFELTWSCHRDGREHCWTCEGCLARAEAFSRAGVPDPLLKPS